MTNTKVTEMQEAIEAQIEQAIKTLIEELGITNDQQLSSLQYEMRKTVGFAMDKVEKLLS